MTIKKMIITMLILMIIILALIATVTGIFYNRDGETTDFVTVRGENIKVRTTGVYKYNPDWYVTEGIAWDIVTLFVGIPLLTLSLVLFNRRSMRGTVLLTGTLAYFFYQYVMWATGLAYNQFFLVYTALYSLSLIALILTLIYVDIDDFRRHITESFPRKTMSAFLIAVGVLVLFMWLSRIIPSLKNNTIPKGFEGVYTLTVQAFDLGIIVPFALFAGILLYRKNVWGYLLASIGVMKFLTMSLAIMAMIIGKVIVNDPLNMAELIIFSIFTLFGVFFVFLLLRNIKEK
jgi:hypothetical protein